MNENSIPDPAAEDKKESKSDNTPIFLDKNTNLQIKDVSLTKSSKEMLILASFLMGCILLIIVIAFLTPW